MSYYYLIASLPSVAMGQAPISEADFHARCVAELTPRDLQAVRDAEAVPESEIPSHHAFVMHWNNHEIQLRNAIAKRRAAKRQIDASRMLRSHAGYTSMIEDAIENAWNQPNPTAT
jgi:hypothetical protein